MTAAAAAAVAATSQITFGKHNRAAVAIIILLLDERSAQQIDIKFHESTGPPVPGKGLRMDQVGQQFRTFDYARTWSRKIRISVHRIDPGLTDRRKIEKSGAVLCGE